MQEGFFFQVFVYLSAAVISVPLAKRLGLGSVLGYLMAGIAIGPFVLGLVGEEGIAMENFKPDGSVEVHGEIWKASSDSPVKKNQKVLVESVDQQHLRLKVKPIN